ncbi:molybdopterin molybdotransferase MoeA [Nocardioides sp. TRM66260-LWL]|uniref:molybdotransferase-like divisome protein Glp n=1 Tax=Nocardioides sp. TRM66260-LWL TaxID=2874478 RepID=UPI001CC81599|nr:gephyrin-like molybdotransferase Glp [Nocardioides sp. TRM66260-LWL]MBZ5735111.1 molybdopterin molybdotransferase MoeA [Nocardioides sp. TRM66260-LWL]
MPDAAVPLEAHLRRILDAVAPLPPRDVPLLQAHGLVLAEAVHADLDLPSFANSSMDGYAVRAADLVGAADDAPVALPVRGSIGAGAGAEAVVEAGTAVKIMTGAPLPPGADAVVPYEWTDAGAETVQVRQTPQAGAHVRPVGDDVARGALLLEAGTRLTSRHLGLLAAIGRPTARVHPRPRVAVVSTGAELRAPGESLGPDAIYDSNSTLLAAAALEAGVEPVHVGRLDDDVDGLWPALQRLLPRVDLVVTSGGVSMGDFDVVKAALRALDPADGEVWFGPVAMQPGKPQGFGLLLDRSGTDGDAPRSVPILTLPGNPVSSYLSFEVFAKPALRRQLGLPDDALTTPTVRARLVGAVGSPAGRRQLLRGRLAADGTVTPVGGAGSHLMGFLAHADALIVVPEELTSVEDGAEVDVIPLPSWAPASRDGGAS